MSPHRGRDDGQTRSTDRSSHLHRVLAEHIREEVRQALQPGDGRAAIPADLATEYIVTTFIVVLNWRVESRSPLSAREVDDVFLALVVPALTSGVDRSKER